jgi:hypothetical protein
MTLTGTTTVANYQAALRSITYRNSDTVTPTAGSRSINFTVNDGTDSSQTAFSTVTVTAVDAPPTATNMDAAESFNEDDAAFSLTNIVVSDNDSSVTATLTLSDHTAGTLSDNDGATYDAATGVWTISNSVANVNTALANVLFTPTADYNQDFTIATAINDATTTITGSKQVTVTAVNDAPVLDAAFSPALTVIQLNETANNGDTVGSIISDGSISDIDLDRTADEAIVITAVDNSHGTWQYSTNNGQVWQNIDEGSLAADQGLLLDGSDPNQLIRFVPAADFYGTASFTFRAWDKTSGTAGEYADTSTSGGTTPFSADPDSATIMVNDIPQISDVTNLTYTENAPAESIAPALIITDRDNTTLQSATVSLNAGYVKGEDIFHYTTAPGISAAWDADTGILTFTGTASVDAYQTTLRSIGFETTGDNPTGGERTIGITVNDGITDSQTNVSTINVIPVNDPPQLTGGASQDYINSQRMVVIDHNITLADPDNSTITGAEISISRGYVQGEDILALSPQAGITVSWNPTTATLTLSGTATTAAYQQALRNITFANTKGFSTSGQRSISITVNDGNLESQTVVSTINVLVNQVVPNDQALVPAEIPADINPLLRADETPAAAIDRLIDEPLYDKNELTGAALDDLNRNEAVRAVITGNNEQLAREYGNGRDSVVIRYLAGFDSDTVNIRNSEIDRILDQLTDKNMPTPPELLLEVEPESRQQPDETKAPLPVAAPGLADQISKEAGSFEQGRQQLINAGKDKPAEQQSAIPAEIAETFAEVYELLQCR